MGDGWAQMSMIEGKDHKKARVNEASKELSRHHHLGGDRVLVYMYHLLCYVNTL